MCVCDLPLSECSSKYKSHKGVLLCLVSLRMGARESVIPSLPFGAGETKVQMMPSWSESKISNERMKRFPYWQQETQWIKLHYNSTEEYLCLFWSAKHICRFVGLPQTNLHHNRMERGPVLWFPNQPSESWPEWVLSNSTSAESTIEFTLL